MDNNEQRDDILDVTDAGNDSYEDLVEQADQEAAAAKDKNEDSVADESEDERARQVEPDIGPGTEQGMSEDDFSGMMSEMDAYDQQQEAQEIVSKNDAVDDIDMEDSQSESNSEAADESEGNTEDADEIQEEDSDDDSEKDEADAMDEEGNQFTQDELDTEFLASSDDDVTDNANGVGRDGEQPTQSHDGNQQAGDHSQSNFQGVPAFRSAPGVTGQMGPQPIQGHNAPAAPGTPLSHSYGAGKKVGASLADLGLGVAAMGVGAVKEGGARVLERLSNKLETKSVQDQPIEQLKNQATNYENDSDVSSSQIDQLASELKAASADSNSEIDHEGLSEILEDIQAELDNGGDDVSDETLKSIEGSISDLNDNVAADESDSDEEASEKAKALQELIERVIESIKKIFSNNKVETAEMSN